MAALRGGPDERLDGLSPRALRIVAHLEVDRERPGATAAALRHYQRALRDPSRGLGDDDRVGCGIPECCPQPRAFRRWLETVLRHLPARDRRILQARLRAIDARW